MTITVTCYLGIELLVFLQHTLFDLAWGRRHAAWLYKLKPMCVTWVWPWSLPLQTWAVPPAVWAQINATRVCWTMVSTSRALVSLHSAPTARCCLCYRRSAATWATPAMVSHWYFLSASCCFLAFEYQCVLHGGGHWGTVISHSVGPFWTAVSHSPCSKCVKSQNCNQNVNTCKFYLYNLYKKRNQAHIIIKRKVWTCRHVKWSLIISVIN